MPKWLIRHGWLGILVLALVALVAFAACGDDDEEKPTATTPAATATPVAAGGPLKIGLIFSYTGGLAQFGPEHEQSARLAVKHINAGGGVLGQDVELVVADDATNPDTGVAEARRLLDVEGVNAIVGALGSTVSVSIAESVTAPAKVLQISGSSTSPSLTAADDDDYLFRTPISDAAQGLVLGQVVKEQLGLDSVCVMYVNNAYGQGLAENFAAAYVDLDGVVTAQVPHAETGTTFVSELNQCVSGDPEALVAISYPTGQAEVYLKEAVEGGLIDNFVFVDGTKSDKMFTTLGIENFDGMSGTAPGALPPSEFTNKFDAAFEAEYGTPYQKAFVRETYDAVIAMALAAEAAGSTDGTAMRDALRDIANAPGTLVAPPPQGIADALAAVGNGEDVDYSGASGSVEFDENGDISQGAIEVWHVDAAGEAGKQLVTDNSYKVDLEAGTVEPIPESTTRSLTPSVDAQQFAAALPDLRGWSLF